MKDGKQLAVLMVAGTLCAGACTSATAALTFQLNTIVDGAMPAGTVPWLTAVFKDSTDGVPGLAANAVRLHLSTKNLSFDKENPQYVNDWYFNFDNTISTHPETDLTYSVVSNPYNIVTSQTTGSGKKASEVSSDILDSYNGKNASITFSFRWDFLEAKEGRFNGGEFLVVDLVLNGGNSSLTTRAFDILSTDNGSSYHTMAHICGIESTKEGSSKP
ncbi:MAG TPA: hypothetical protein VEC99_04610 [Clostridia bacterium]|nr:hypothetical protein [Clostridia bacterium]